MNFRTKIAIGSGIVAAVLVIGVLWFDSRRIQNRDSEPKKESDKVNPSVSPSIAIPEKPLVAVYIPPPVKNLSLSKLVDRRAKESERIFADMSSRFQSVNDPADQAALVRVLEDLKDSDTVRNEVANLLRRSNYAGLDDSLLKVLKNHEENARFRSFAAQHLGVSASTTDDKCKALAPELRTLLADRDIPVRREALLALVRLNDESGKATAIAWLKEQSADADKVRDLSIRCIRELGLKEFLPDIRAMTKSPDEATCIAALRVRAVPGEVHLGPVPEPDQRTLPNLLAICAQESGRFLRKGGFAEIGERCILGNFRNNRCRIQQCDLEWTCN